MIEERLIFGGVVAILFFLVKFEFTKLWKKSESNEISLNKIELKYASSNDLVLKQRVKTLEYDMNLIKSIINDNSDKREKEFNESMSVLKDINRSIHAHIDSASQRKSMIDTTTIEKALIKNLKGAL